MKAQHFFIPAVLYLLLFAVSPMESLADLEQAGKTGVNEILDQPEVQRFLGMVPGFLLWARGLGIIFNVAPSSGILQQEPVASRFDEYLRSKGWDKDRFLFLLCLTSAGAQGNHAKCMRKLRADEEALLRDFSVDTMVAYGTGP